VDGPEALAADSDPVKLTEFKKDADEQFATLKNPVLMIYAPMALLFVFGLAGVASGKFGRALGIFTLIAAAVGGLFAYGMMTGVKEKDPAAIGMGIYVMLGAAAVGGLGGLIALVAPDHGREG
jgi:hypothetical protein